MLHLPACARHTKPACALVWASGSPAHFPSDHGFDLIPPADEPSQARQGWDSDECPSISHQNLLPLCYSAVDLYMVMRASCLSALFVLLRHSSESFPSRKCPLLFAVSKQPCPGLHHDYMSQGSKPSIRTFVINYRQCLGSNQLQTKMTLLSV